MAEVEQVGLLIEGDTLYGVAVGSGVVRKAHSWRFVRPASATIAAGEAAAGQGAVPPVQTPPVADGISEVLPDERPSEAAVSGDGEASAESAGDSLAVGSLVDALAAARTTFHAEDGCVLALPPDELVAKVISLPPVESAAIDAMVRLQMEKFAPVSGDALAVASEVVGATEDSTRVFAVAMPMARLDALAENLAASGVRVSRIDSALLCEWRMYQDCAARHAPSDCHAVLFALPSGRCDVFVADAVGIAFARSLGCHASAESLVREIVLSVLNLGEDFSGLTPERLVYVSATPPAEDFMVQIDRALGIGVDWLDAESVGHFAEGVLRRDSEEGHIDIIPPAWRDIEKQSVARGRFLSGVVAALLVWAVAAAALYLMPRFMQRRLTTLDTAIEAVRPAYRAVSGTRTKVRLIRSYQDRSHSLLDVLRTVCAKMPDGIVFSSISYEKGGEASSNSKSYAGGVKIVGDADRSATVLEFKDILDGSGLFAPAKLNGPILDGKRQRYRFDIDSRFAEAEERP